MITNFINMLTCSALLWTLLIKLSRLSKKRGRYDLLELNRTPMSSAYQNDSVTTMHIRLREVRENVGITQGELARRSGVSVSHISEIEANRVVPTVFVMKRIARALGVSVDELIEEVSNTLNL